MACIYWELNWSPRYTRKHDVGGFSTVWKRENSDEPIDFLNIHVGSVWQYDIIQFECVTWENVDWRLLNFSKSMPRNQSAYEQAGVSLLALFCIMEVSTEIRFLILMNWMNKNQITSLKIRKYYFFYTQFDIFSVVSFFPRWELSRLIRTLLWSQLENKNKWYFKLFSTEKIHVIFQTSTSRVG